MPVKNAPKPEEIRCVERHLRRGYNLTEIAALINMTYHKVRKIQQEHLSHLATKHKLEPPHKLQSQRTPDPENTYAHNCLGDPALARSALGQRMGLWSPPDDAERYRVPMPKLPSLRGGEQHV